MIISFYLFTRDLHINEKFIEICTQSDIVIPLFNFTETQISNKNKFRSFRSILFMINSLKELYEKLNNINLDLLYLYSDSYTSIFNTNFIKLINNIKEDYIYKLNNELNHELNNELTINFYICNDYTLYAKNRNKYLEDICSNNSINFIKFEHICLFTPGTILTGSGNVYQKFTPFYNNCISKIKSLKEYNSNINKKFSFNSYETNIIKKINNYFNKYMIKIDDIIYTKSGLNLSKKEYNNIYNNMLVKGSRSNALNILKHIDKSDIKDYETNRDILTYSTTHLSAYLKFGCINVREVYFALLNKSNKNTTLIKQLIWRDFYYHIANEFNYVFNGQSFKTDYDKIKWKFNEKYFNAWTNGLTGVPIVDACMRELNNTGYMHNRGRLIVASYLVKNLLIDWRYGEQYFAQQLTDYDPSVNNGNWQWVASSGTDSQPYFRIFNPYSQSKKHDINAEYIKKWVDELKDVDSKHIHDWDKKWSLYVGKENFKYIKPIIEYESNKFKELYKSYLN